MSVTGTSFQVPIGQTAQVAFSLKTRGAIR